MSTARLTRTTVTLAALTLAAALSACGTDAQPLRDAHGARTPRASDEQTIARRLNGLFTASIRGSAVRDLPGLHVPAGTWALRIDVAARTFRLIPPEGGDITLRLASVDASHLRLAPDTACESRTGRTAAGQFTWIRTNAFLRLQSVHAPCRSDATVLTTAPWQAAWPTTALTTNAPPTSR